MENTKPRSFVTLPGAIIVAGALIAIAIIWTNKPSGGERASDTADKTEPSSVNIRAISSGDHILGNPDAPIKIVEYSDPSCPYCKIFNSTMTKIMDEYGPVGKVAWVYRHYPLNKPDPNGRILHPNAGRESEAFECAADLGDATAFWKYEKILYEKTPSVTYETPEGLDPAMLPVFAKEAGLDVKDFNECLDSGRFQDKVEADYLDGVNAGISGTPYSLIVTKDGKKIPVVGAQSYKNMKDTLDILLNNGY